MSEKPGIPEKPCLELMLHPIALGGVVEIGPNLFIGADRAEEIGRRFLDAASQARQGKVCPALLMKRPGEREPAKGGLA